MNTTEWLDHCKAEVAAGKELPSQYLEQCRISYLEKEISVAELNERINSIPFCPALVDGFVKQA